LDSESSNPSSNLGGTYFPCDIYLFLRQPFLISLVFLLKNKSDNSIVQLRMFDFAFLQPEGLARRNGGENKSRGLV
jgi:hypothetical protein